MSELSLVSFGTRLSAHDENATYRPSAEADGQLLFVEHGLSPDRGLRKWQDRLNPVWKKIAGGCHLNRPIAELIEVAGFRLSRLERGYMQGPKPMTFMYEGSARPR